MLYRTLVWNGVVYRAVESLGNVLALNLLWLAASLPVVTFPPATAAMFDVARRWRAGDGGGAGRLFVSALVERFRQRFGLGLGWMIVGVVLFVDLVAAGRMTGPGQVVLGGMSGLMVTLYLAFSVRLFPVMVSFDTTWREIVRTSAFLAAGTPGATLLCLGVVVVAAGLVVISPVALFVVGSCTACAIYAIHDRAFRIKVVRRSD